MTIPPMWMIWSADERDPDGEQVACATCGERVADPVAHRRQCVDHELGQFAAGRRAS